MTERPRTRHFRITYEVQLPDAVVRRSQIVGASGTQTALRLLTDALFKQGLVYRFIRIGEAVA